MLIDTLLYKLYRFKFRSLRAVIIWIAYKRDGGPMYSSILRRIFKDYRKVDIGMYTHGSCFILGNFNRYTTIGRYCSIAAGVRVFNRDHPTDYKSMHIFFFNSLLKYVKEDSVQFTPLRIGNDVWIGYGAIILPNVTEIGDGAVIGANAIVAKNVPPYAVVVGHPARVVRYRFSKPIIEKLLAEKWWKKSIEEIQENFDEYTQPYEAYLSAHDLISKKDESGTARLSESLETEKGM